MSAFTNGRTRTSRIRVHGEWFGYLHRDGTVSTRLKGNLWKGPFHLPRMQWFCTQRIEEMLQQGAV